MSILGKFTKQPREVEIYAIQFAEDMSDTDDLTGGYCALAYSPGGTEKDVTGAYAAVLADSGSLIYADTSMTLPGSPSVGFNLAVSNINQNSAITVGSFTVPARGAVIVLYTAAGWTREIYATAIIVSVPGDHRIRMVITGGLNGSTYKGQISATTAEGRVLEDEMTIRVKEI